MSSYLFRLLLVILIALNYQQTGVAATSGQQGACCGAVLIGGSQEQSSLCTIGGSGASSPVTVGGSQFDIGTGQAGVMFEIEPTASVVWEAGTWTIRLNVTTANANVTWASTYICRLNAAGVSQATIGSNVGHNTSLSTTGVKTNTVTGASQSPAAGDSAYVVLVFNVANSNNQTFACQFNQLVDTPFSETVTLTASKGALAFTAKVATFETIVPPSQTQAANISVLEWSVPHTRALLFDKTPEAETGQTTLTADKGALTLSGQAGTFRESVLADKSTLAFAGKDATFVQLVALTADKGALTFSPQSGLFKETFLADKSSLSLAAKDATFAQLVALTANKGSLTFAGKDATFTGVPAEIPILPGLFHFELPTPIPPDSLVAYSMPDFYPFGRLFSLEQRRPESLITISINLALPVEANTLTASKGMLSFSPKPSVFQQTLAANKNTLLFASKDASFLQVLALLAEKGLITLSGDESLFIEKLLATKGAMDFTGRTAQFPAGEAPALWPITRAAVWR